MYAISLYVFSQADKDTQIKIVRDGDEMVRFWADGESGHDLSNDVGGMIVLECDIGQTISAIAVGGSELDDGADGLLFSAVFIQYT